MHPNANFRPSKSTLREWKSGQRSPPGTAAVHRPSNSYHGHYNLFGKIITSVLLLFSLQTPSRYSRKPMATCRCHCLRSAMFLNLKKKKENISGRPTAITFVIDSNLYCQQMFVFISNNSSRI